MSLDNISLSVRDINNPQPTSQFYACDFSMDLHRSRKQPERPIFFLKEKLNSFMPVNMNTAELNMEISKQIF